jgi:hypothetical protein
MADTIVAFRVLGGINADGAFTSAGTIISQNMFKTFNGLHGDLTLAAGENITLSPVGNTITIASTASGSGTASGLEQTFLLMGA